MDEKTKKMEEMENLILSFREFVDDSGILTLRRGNCLNIFFKDQKIKFVFLINKIQLLIFANDKETCLVEATDASEISVYKLLSSALMKFLGDIDNPIGN